MEIKKNENAKLENYTTLFFEIGLALALLIVNLSIEYKSVDKTLKDLASIESEEEIVEDIPITQKIEQVKPPPPPPAAPEQIDIVENIEDVEETVLESTETDQNESIEVTEIDDIEEAVEEEVVVEDVPFAIIEEVPIYPGCEKGSKKEKRKCLESKIIKHVGKNFNSGLAGDLGLTPGKKRVFVQFRIDKKGEISDVRVRGPHKRLETEALRVIRMLPKMIPGKQRGRPVGVKYALPITLDVQ